MRLVPSDDLAQFDAAVARVLADHRDRPAPLPLRWQHAPALEQALAEAGFFDALHTEGLGRVAAVSMVMAAAALPACAEVMASALLAPLLDADLPRPLAVLVDDPARPARFLPMAATVLVLGADAVRAAPLPAGAAQAVDSSFAFPMGVLRDPQRLPWQPLAGASAAALRDQLRLGLAAELVGCLDAGLQAVLAHVRARRQFGRPLGSFQAVQHRLAEAATAITGARWLTLRAADSGTPADTALALGQAQSIARRIVYDLHQFMGAMGLTLEHPLHRWTYRAKWLLAELGGSDAQFQAAAAAAWPCPTPPAAAPARPTP